MNLLSKFQHFRHWWGLSVVSNMMDDPSISTTDFLKYILFKNQVQATNRVVRKFRNLIFSIENYKFAKHSIIAFQKIQIKRP
jgi:hypothetical protein